MVRIVALDIDKDRGMFCGGLCKKWLPYNTYSSDNSSWILNGLMSSCFDKCWYDISDDESGMAKDIRFKPRVEATEQMTQNWTFRNPRISESANIASKWQVCNSYSMFPFYFTPGNLSWGNLYVKSSSVAFIDNREKQLCKYLIEMCHVLLLSEFILDVDRKIPRQIFLVDFG